MFKKPICLRCRGLGKVPCHIFGGVSVLKTPCKAQFNQYLKLVGIKYITAAPFHPETNDKIESYLRIFNGAIDHRPYQMPAESKEAISALKSY